MTIDELPRGVLAESLEFSHFPTRLQAVVWRNWGLIPIPRLAEVLATTPKRIAELAAEMGLRPATVSPHWLERGFLTLIRNNWHLLPYEQLLQLLNWSPERLAYTLREDDFLWTKLGNFKPQTMAVLDRPLSESEVQQTIGLREIVHRHFGEYSSDSVAPFAFLGEFSGDAMVPTPAIPRQTPSNPESSTPGLRLIYSYSAVYGDPLLHPELDPYPDGLLKRYADLGINSIWIRGILYALYACPERIDIAGDHELRLDNLQHLVERAARFGIGVYLYLNEPRGLPLANFNKIPQWQGVVQEETGDAAMCTSQPGVLGYIADGCARVFERVPDLAGVFAITMSENLTNCHSRGRGDDCPLCSKRDPVDIIAEIIGAIEGGIHRVNSKARVIAWNWAWSNEWAPRVIDRLPPDVELMCTSEEAVETAVGGVGGRVHDYSISQVGPGPYATQQWQHAQARGLKPVAKVQLNSTWECSAVPYLPVPQLVGKHLDGLRQAGIDDFMLSWTLGGYPSFILELLSANSLTETLEHHFPSNAVALIEAACEQFSAAFTEFPFSISVVYHAPQTFGPMNLLHLFPTGFTATMLGFPYDDLQTWRNIYPEDVFESQFRILSDTWQEGLKTLDDARAAVQPADAATLNDLHRIATAAWCHFRSTYLQISFVRRRARPQEHIATLNDIVDEEIQLAKTLLSLVRQDSRIGFEASNHYYYTQNDLIEKVINCECIRQQLNAGPA